MPFELVIGGVIFLNPHVRMSVSRLDGLYVGLSQFFMRSRSSKDIKALLKSDTKDSNICL